MLTNAMLVRKSTGSIGATKLLKVMAGDRIHTKVDYYYNLTSANNATGGTLSTLVSAVVNALTYSTAASALLKEGTGTVSSQLSGNTALGDFLSAPPETNPNNSSQQAPKAYLCVLFFDEQMRFDPASSRITPVQYLQGGASGSLERMLAGAATAGKNGYAYVYFTNESDELVYFDNFLLSHERGPLLEETHYYPFGLTMAGISSKAAGGLENKKGYNGNELQIKEFSDGTGLEFYDFNARMYDQQLGRFMQVDPLSEEGDQESWGPFQFTYDNPVRYSDPDGKCPCLIPIIIEAINAAVIATTAYIASKETEKGLQQLKENIDNKRMNDQPIVKTEAPKEKAEDNQNSNSQKKWGTYSHDQSQQPLPRKRNGEPAPDPEATGPHTQLGRSKGESSGGPYNQAREFDANGKPVKDIDFTDHGRPQKHPNPHQHNYHPPKTGGTLQRGKVAVPLVVDVIKLFTIFL